MMLLMGIWISLTKKPMKPIIAKPIAVAIAIFWNSVTLKRKISSMYYKKILTIIFEFISLPRGKLFPVQHLTFYNPLIRECQLNVKNSMPVSLISNSCIYKYQCSHDTKWKLCLNLLIIVHIHSMQTIHKCKSNFHQ